MTAEAQLRSLYRLVLRELPAGKQGSMASPLRNSIRKHFSDHTNASDKSNEWHLARRQEAAQFIQYLQAQRIYGTLLERYNPGMSMNEEERVRLTARRVGMDMPEEWYGKA